MLLKMHWIKYICTSAAIRKLPTKITMYDLEVYIFGIIPMILGLLILVKSIQLSINRNTIQHRKIMLTIIISSIPAEYMLGMISFCGAWPSFIPHILLLFNIILLTYQFLMNRKKNTQLHQTNGY